MRLAEALPRWDHRERHRIAVTASPDAVLRAAEEVTWSEVPLFRFLMAVRFPGRVSRDRGATVFDWFTQNGFAVLDRADDELVVGTIKPTAGVPVNLDAFRRFAHPGHIKIGFNFWCADGALTTETRVLATDLRSRRWFAVYWLVIRAGSGLIRRVWLRAIRRRAEAPVGDTLRTRR